MRQIFNPFKTESDVAVASAAAGTESHVATASALTNNVVDCCPKCGVNMGSARLADDTSVFYCVPCRVSHPKE